MNDVIEFFYLKKFAVKVRVQLQLCMMHVEIFTEDFVFCMCTSALFGAITNFNINVIHTVSVLLLLV